MKICLVTTGLGVGGAEKQVCDLADVYEQKENEVIIISLTGTPDIKPINNKVRIYSFNMQKSFFSLFITLIRVRKVIKQFSPDVVHSHMLHANIFCRLIRLCTKIKVLISTAHNTYEGNLIWMTLYRFTDFLATISTNVSEASVEAFLKSKASCKNKMIVQYNGIDCDNFSPSYMDRVEYREKLKIKNEDILLLSIGRLTEAKNHSMLLSCFSDIKENFSNVKLAIIGTGELRENLQQKIESLNIQDSVFMLGTSFDIKQWMSASDIFVLTSKWEGMPLVICEAMSCEKIVVSTDCGGVREIIDGCGYISPVDNNSKYIENLKFALSLDANERLALGKKSRKKILENFSLDKVSDEWLALYKVLSKNK